MRTPGTRILLVEDNPGDVRLLREYMRNTGQFMASIRHVETLKDALKALDSDTFDVLFLDLSLPDSRGFNTFLKIHAHADKTPIILLTGTEDETLAMRALHHGAQDYLVKHRIDDELLVRSMRYAIERNRLLVEMEKARTREQHLAYHDALTDLPNRLLLGERIDQALIYAKRYQGVLAVLFVDLDGFKEVNDRMGHGIGDKLLQCVADRLLGNVRESDTVARLGGDEFIILLRGVTKIDNIDSVARKLIEATSKPYIIDRQRIDVTASIGISVFPYDGSDCEKLIKKADFAMYRAKSQGKNAYQFFNTFVDSSPTRLTSLESMLHDAIEKESFTLFFQPQVGLENGQLSGLEALVRWKDTQFVTAPPEQFLPLAEDTGLILPLGKWILKTACTRAQEWRSKSRANVPVSVNLSSRQFRDPGLVASIAETLASTGLPPALLLLEVKESTVMENVRASERVLRALRELGITIAIDDHGAGFSSLRYLQRLPIDVLKLDGSLVQRLPENRDDAALLKAVIALANAFELDIVAKGVETRAQVDFLKEMGCYQAQGKILSEPVHEDRLPELFAASSFLPSGSGIVQIAG